jgi:hypothetical protein
VHESSTPAEIRLAYRIRSLELTATKDGGSHEMKAQLACGFQILVDPQLRREYLSLLNAPEHAVAFPPWTGGTMLATGEKRGRVHRP